MIVIVLGQAQAKLGPEVLLGTVAILCSALCYAVNIVMMRHQALAAKPLEINFFQSLTVHDPVAGGVPLLGMPAWPAGQWPWIVVASILSTGGTLLFAWAYARAKRAISPSPNIAASCGPRRSAGSSSANASRSTRSPVRC